MGSIEVEATPVKPEAAIIKAADNTSVNIPTQLIPNTTPLKPGETKINAFSLSSIKQRKALEKVTKTDKKDHSVYPTEPFSETDMWLLWTKFSKKLEDRGMMILNSLMTMNEPLLQGTTIIHELPNESSKTEFESTKNELLGYLRGMLHNHDITIEIVVNEKATSKRAFTPEDKYNRLKEINPNIELLRKTFDLDY